MGDTFGSFGIHFNHSFYVKKGIHWLNGGASRKKNRQVCSNNTLEKLGKTKFIALKLTFFKKQFKIGAKLPVNFSDTNRTASPLQWNLHSH